MSKDLSGNVITANNLLDGTVVYMSSQFKWVLNINNAKVFSNDSSIEKALVHANKQQDEIVAEELKKDDKENVVDADFEDVKDDKEKSA